MGDPYNTTGDPSAFNIGEPRYKPELLERPLIYLPYPRINGKTLWERSVMLQMQRRTQEILVILHRLPTQEELDAFVPIFSRVTNRERLGVPIGLTLGLAHTYYSYRQQAPQGSSPSQTIRAVLSGAKNIGWGNLVAPLAWRVLSWSTLSLAFFYTYSKYKEALEVIAEPRLERFRHELRQMTPEELRRRKLEYANKLWQERQARRGTAGKGDEVSQSPFDQASPTSAEASPLYPNSDRSPSTGPYSTQPSATADYGNADVQRGRWQQPTGRTPQYGQRTGSGSSAGSSDFFDDASPTNPEYESSRSVSTTNAWERLRQSNTSSANPITKPTGSSLSSNAWDQRVRTDNDSSSYSNEDRLRQQEKEKAQQEFDRMLEAERRASMDSQPPMEDKKGGWRRW